MVDSVFGSVTARDSSRRMMPLPEQLGSSRMDPTLFHCGSTGSSLRKSCPAFTTTMVSAPASVTIDCNVLARCLSFSHA